MEAFPMMTGGFWGRRCRPVTSTLTASINGTAAWSGPAATTFRQAWNTRYRASLADEQAGWPGGSGNGPGGSDNGSDGPGQDDTLLDNILDNPILSGLNDYLDSAGLDRDR